MSLFQAREWWRAPSEATDEYSAGGLLIANIDNAPDGQDKIVTGSFLGALRIHAPRRGGASGTGSVGGVGGMSGGVGGVGAASALLLDMQLRAPILQLAAGRFQPGSTALALAVLHPHKVTVYSISTSSNGGGGGGGVVDAGKGLKLASLSAADALQANLLYEQVFSARGAHFTACNMCYGPFGVPNSSTTGGASLFHPPPPGSAASKDYIAVQSMDGQLQVYEQDKPGFRRQMPGVLLPGPLAYLPRTNSFLTMASDLVLTVYHYASLATSATGAGAGGTSGGGAANSGSLSARDAEGKEGDGTPRVGGAGAGAGGGSGAPPLAPKSARGPGKDKPGASGAGATTVASKDRDPRPNWSMLLGEVAHSLLLGRFSRAVAGNAEQGDAVVVGQRTMFILRDTGLTNASSAAGLGALSPIRSQKRLDFHPVAACIFPRSDGSASGSGNSKEDDTPTVAAHAALGMDNLLLVTHTGQVRVYREEALVWSASLPFVPVAVGVGRYAGTPGLITLLSARGDVSVCYLGTDPPTGSITGGEAVRSLDYAAMNAEHRALMRTIRDRQAAAGKEPEEKLTVKAVVPTTVDAPTSYASASSGGPAHYEDEDWESPGGGTSSSGGRLLPVVTVKLQLQYSGKTPIKDVRVNISPPDWVCMLREGHGPGRSQVVMGPGEEESAGLITAASGILTVTAPFRCSPKGMPADTNVSVVVTYTVASGEQRVCHSDFALPLALACALVPPLKSATHKFTVEMNRPPPPLSTLFTDMMSQPPHVLPQDALMRLHGTASSVLTFQLVCGGDVTILASKTGGRFRIQSGVFEALALITNALVERLTAYYRTGGPGDAVLLSESKSSVEGGDPLPAEYMKPLSIRLVEAPPMPPLFDAMDAHLAARHTLAAAYSELNDRCHEYRLVTKRLLVRFKDKTPAPLAGLDVLMLRAHQHMMDAANRVLTCQQNVAAAGASLSCGIKLLHVLVACTFSLSGEQSKLLQAYVTPRVTDTIEAGWEEAVEAALTLLLRNNLTVPGTAASAAATAAAAASASGLTPSGLAGIPQTADRVKKQIAIVWDRLSKGAAVSTTM